MGTMTFFINMYPDSTRRAITTNPNTGRMMKSIHQLLGVYLVMILSVPNGTSLHDHTATDRSFHHITSRILGSESGVIGIVFPTLEPRVSRDLDIGIPRLLECGTGGVFVSTSSNDETEKTKKRQSGFVFLHDSSSRHDGGSSSLELRQVMG